MSPGYAETVKLVEDNYFHWEFNMRMKLSRKGLLAHILKPELDALRDVSLTYQVYIRGSTTAADSWRMLEGQFNRNTLKNRLIVTKKLHNFKMESGTRFAVHVDQFKEIVLQMETIGEPLHETRQLVLLLGSMRDEYQYRTREHAEHDVGKAFVAKKSYDKRRFNGKCFWAQGNGVPQEEG
ncbi:hypothetical protein PR003_g24100 [Phytophthora rubi]|uniref:Polyprotein n=1 Tax=Phytophthora rubi TaxID=129364 RepID=A0A6A4CTT3_9STRA|nr:hypothetical protein PR003_g24100 [Phytophthora rubi]